MPVNAGRRSSNTRSSNQCLKLCGDLVPALTALPRERLGVVAPPEIVVAQQSDRRARKAVVIAGYMTGHAIDNTLDDAAERLHDRRHAHRLRLGERKAEGLAGVAAIQHDA